MNNQVMNSQVRGSAVLPLNQRALISSQPQSVSFVRFSGISSSEAEELSTLYPAEKDIFSIDQYQDAVPVVDNKVERNEKSAEERLSVQYQEHLDAHGVKGHNQLLKGLRKTKEILGLFPEASVAITMGDAREYQNYITSALVTIDINDQQTIKHKETMGYQFYDSRSSWFASQKDFVKTLNKQLKKLLESHFGKRDGFVLAIKNFWTNEY